MEELEKSFIERYNDDFLYYVDDNRYDWMKREEYIEAERKKNRIYEDYPRVEKYVETSNIPRLNKQDLEALREYMDIERDIDIIEQKQIFKLGFREALLFFKELGFLKIEKQKSDKVSNKNSSCHKTWTLA